MSRYSSEEAARVLVETLRLGRFDKSIELNDIATKSRASLSLTKEVLMNVLGTVDDTRISLDSTARVRIAVEAARAGRLKEAAQAISWQEFEKFGEQCLEMAEFRTKRNVRVKGEGRAWQIDLVGFRGELIVAIDCKHWNTPSSVSRFKLAANHQRHAALHLLATLNEKMDEGSDRRQAIAVILTLLEPPAQCSGDAVLVAVEKFPSFLGGVTPYDENLPFITSSSLIVENPMSQSS